jgi:hypothetical protein|tara:strand:+ start:198 stop:464 length:267 start_codon:yes stop_codon:yes gene_type:complete
MAKFSKKMMGKEVGDAKVYATPHTMTGKVVKASSNPGSGPNHSKLDTVDMGVGGISKSAGEKPAKTSGIKIRGTGAATKGLMARGPMA